MAETSRSNAANSSDAADGDALHQRILGSLPAPVTQLFELFSETDAALFLVGGAVRDFCRGQIPSDYDFTVGCSPEFLHTFLLQKPLSLDLKGLRFGTIGVILEGHSYEISPFRREGRYADRRHPVLSELRFDATLEEDLARRDFTVNAMAWNPARGLVDLYGGLRDLRAGILRTVGDPRRRMAEDSLRILRGVRFAAQLDAQLDPATEGAMLQMKESLLDLPQERVGEELSKLLAAPSALDRLSRYPWAWNLGLQETADSPGRSLRIPSEEGGLERLSHAAQDALRTAEERAAFLFLLSRREAVAARQGSVGRVGFFRALAPIYRRSLQEELRSLRPLLEGGLGLSDIEAQLLDWAWPGESRLRILSHMLDVAVALSIPPGERGARTAQILWPEVPLMKAPNDEGLCEVCERYRMESVFALLTALGFPDVARDWAEGTTGTEGPEVPLDQEDLGLSAEALMAQGIRGAGIREFRTGALLEDWEAFVSYRDETD